MGMELGGISTVALDTTRCNATQFSSYIQMAEKSLQRGNYPEAEHNLQLADQQRASSHLGEMSEARIVRLQIYLEWYQRHFREALEKAQSYLKLVDGEPHQNERVQARALLADLHRDSGQLRLAHFWYAEAQKCMKELDVYSYASWVEGQMAWLYLLEGRFTHARLQIEAIRGQSNPSQAMHVQVLVAILQMLDGEWESAEGLLNEALTFYERADEPLICCALHFYLAYNALHQYMPTLFLSHANQAFSWMTQHEIATVPHWWHPKIMAEICTHALMSDLHAPLIEQILVHHLGQAAMPALKLLENTEDIDLRRKANRLHQIIAGRNTDSLSHLGNTPSKSVLYELLNSGNLRLETYPLLEQELTTASRRQRPNATILAVFGLYINGYTRDEIAKRLECSVENVRNYITVIYHHFDLPDHQYKGRELRRQKLIELARERGYIH